MEAASRGAKSADGLTVGFLPAMDPKTANAYVDLIFPNPVCTLLGCESGDAAPTVGVGTHAFCHGIGNQNVRVTEYLKLPVVVPHDQR